MLTSEQRLTVGGADDRVTIRLDLPAGVLADEMNTVRELAEIAQAEIRGVIRGIELAVGKRRPLGQD